MAAASKLTVGDETYEIFRLDALQASHDVARLPYTLRILLENVLRNAGDEEVEAVAGWVAQAEPSREISFTPARVLHQDFTGVPAVVDLAAMRNAMQDFGGNPALINPLLPSELVIDHSVQVDAFASRFAFAHNAERELERNRERYAFLRWGQTAFDNFKVVPPDTGIVHQINLEYLARVVEARDGRAFPDTLVGTDSHTTMVNGLGVLGWGVGGIEAEAAMLGESLSMLVPQVVGFRLAGRLPEGSTATDLVLTVTEILRRTGVVGKFVEYFGHGVSQLSLADRATIGNMSPEYGATCGFFPVDDETLRYLRMTGRDERRLALVEAYCKENLLWHDPDDHPVYTQVVDLDLSTVEPSIAGPRRPQDRVALARAKEAFVEALGSFGVDYPDGSYDKEGREQLPGERPADRRRVPRERAGCDCAASARHGHGRRRERRELRALPRLRRDRRDHVLHEHVQPERDDRRRAAREEGRRARAREPPVGEDLARPGLEGRDRVLRAGRPDRLPRGARLPHGRLRLHDLHRELRPAARGGLARGHRERPRRLRGAVREPELRGPHPPRGEGELPRLAAARRRLRARRADGPRPVDGAARARPRRRARLPARPLAERGGGRRHDRRRGAQRDVQPHLCRRLHGRRRLALARHARGRPVRLGAGLDLRAPAAVLRRDEPRARHRRRHRGRAAAS